MTDLVSGNGHPVYDREVESAKMLVCLVELWLQGHEDNNHLGEICPSMRVSLCAYIAHCVGVRDQESIERMCEIINDYEEAHD